jgi:hypothetical protein
LAELLVALVVFAVVSAGAFYLLSSQNREWKLTLDRTSLDLVGKGTLDELQKAVRTSGSGLPDSVGGMKVWASGEEMATFVSNLGGGIDSAAGFDYVPDAGSGKLWVQVTDALNFEDSGYARLDLLTAVDHGHGLSGSGGAKSYTLRILDRVSGCGSDSVILDVSSLVAEPHKWDQPGDVRVPYMAQVVNIDSNTYRKSNDTLYVRHNSQPLESVLTTGVDFLRFWYHHPVDGWLDSLSPTAPANQVDKVRIRLVMRTGTVDPVLLQHDPSSRGYQLLRMETEVATRTAALTNR